MGNDVNEEYDLVVVGAGFYGLAAAKTHLALHPEKKLLVIEAEATCGGTWSHNRLYPSLKTNNLFGSLEYPDFPMDGTKYSLKEGEHIPGKVMHEYCEDYAKHFGVLERVRFETEVISAKAMTSGGWTITTKEASTETSTITAHKLIIATGLTSQPNKPSFTGAAEFSSPIFHARDFCDKSHITSTASRAVVIGGGKSAFDVAYKFATSSTCTEGVDLLIRPSGNGPVWMANAYATPFKLKVEDLVLVRFLTWFSPCAWGDEAGYGVVRRFLQATWLGNIFVRLFFWAVGADIMRTVGYDNHPETKKLKPWYGTLWANSALGVWNYDKDFLGLVRQGTIRVHLAEVESLGRRVVELKDGKRLDGVDVVVCATGWVKEDSSSMAFKDFDTGLALSGEERDALIRKADKKLFAKLPILKAQPVKQLEDTTTKQNLASGKVDSEPRRYYRFIVPSQATSSRNIAFAGGISTTSTALTAHLQGLWITAFFDGNLDRSPPADKRAVVDEIIRHTQFEKWRHPCGYGPLVPDMTFDSLSYVDLLMNDLGLKVRRKKSILRDVFLPYKPRDYATILKEYQARCKSATGALPPRSLLLLCVSGAANLHISHSRQKRF
ncbi:uncharacterized protein B0I36DRAFT_256916 [Microdochium trichocladiopsis]|uniref:L-ornithine N(5)-oxygenase n=1 Tax=Microdochium trichocladiopsis TaxID=1682393 RepID=A0A9P8XSE8_9PEZI|nr:uncharacterized protein B0I36DRAFT_256916 [Microdochium trichocladiopsis]KAH7012110.1 hypothetical protein B0I36DRAFT_256916 [Microdochium trichocladiopsis]